MRNRWIMKSWTHRSLLLLPFLVASGAAVADGYDAKTAAALQSVITRQIEALARGDGAAAEAFAAPGIRARFPDPAGFLGMVRAHYGALIHPRSTQFAVVTSSPQGPLQKMTVVSADGTVWTAIYSFTQVGGDWRITGCALEKDDDQQAI